MPMKQGFDHRQVWRQYQDALAYCRSLDLQTRVQRCEDFYNGDQWKGCEAADLDKPVMNILHRVVSYFISSVISDDIAVSLGRFDRAPGEENLLRGLETELQQVMENTGLKRKLRQVLRDAAVDGDGCLHFWFDPAAGEGGSLQAEVINNTNVFFGNRHSSEIQTQPWILLRCRRPIDEVRAAAKAAGAAGWPSLKADLDPPAPGSGSEPERVTVVRKYEKRGGRIWYSEVCESGTVIPPTPTGCRLFPLGWMPWQAVKNRCYGKGAIEALIPNQIYINKLYAMAMRHVMMCAFPKFVYNAALLPEGISNRVGEAIPVYGPPEEAFGHSLTLPDMSNQVMQLIRQTMEDTRDCMGASEVSLGNVTPDNTSAIIAVQKATAQPLELQKMAFYDLVEECVRILLDLMAARYGKRPLWGEGEETIFDFSRLRQMNLKLRVDIGASAYWSEILQVQTLDSLYSRGLLTDPALYLECLPAGYVKGRGRILNALQKQKTNETKGEDPDAERK